MTKLNQAIKNINFDENNVIGGEYGLHDGFFNFLTEIDGINYHVQCCADEDGLVNLKDCGYDEGSCSDCNDAIAQELANDVDGDISGAWEQVFELIESAVKANV